MGSDWLESTGNFVTNIGYSALYNIAHGDVQECRPILTRVYHPTLDCSELNNQALASYVEEHQDEMLNLQGTSRALAIPVCIAQHQTKEERDEAWEEHKRAIAKKATGAGGEAPLTTAGGDHWFCLVLEGGRNGFSLTSYNNAPYCKRDVAESATNSLVEAIQAATGASVDMKHSPFFQRENYNGSSCGPVTAMVQFGVYACEEKAERDSFISRLSDTYNERPPAFFNGYRTVSQECHNIKSALGEGRVDITIAQEMRSDTKQRLSNHMDNVQRYPPVSRRRPVYVQPKLRALHASAAAGFTSSRRTRGDIAAEIACDVVTACLSNGIPGDEGALWGLGSVSQEDYAIHGVGINPPSSPGASR